MSRIRSRMGGGLLIASAAMLFGSGVGCQAEPVGAPPPAPAAGQPVAYETPASGEAPAATPDGVGADVAYGAAPPVDDIESYPSVVYDGMPVYYVSGMWYRHDSRGWGAYREEPQELARQRGLHESDPRWAQASGRPSQPTSRPGAAERQPAVENRSPQLPRQGVTERQPAESRPQQSPPPASHVQPAGGHPATAPVAQPPRGNAPAGGSHAPARAHESEHR